MSRCRWLICVGLCRLSDIIRWQFALTSPVRWVIRMLAKWSASSSRPVNVQFRRSLRYPLMAVLAAASVLTSCGRERPFGEVTPGQPEVEASGSGADASAPVPSPAAESAGPGVVEGMDPTLPVVGGASGNVAENDGPVITTCETDAGVLSPTTRRRRCRVGMSRLLRRRYLRC